MSASSLLLAGTEILNCDRTGPGVFLLLEYDYGDPQGVTAAVEAILLDGDRVLVTRAGNRTFDLPLIVKGTTRTDLTARMDALLFSVKNSGYTVSWTPMDGLEILWDCFTAQPQITWDVQQEDRLFVQKVHLVIPALPYGRNPDPETVTLTDRDSDTAWRISTLSDIIGSARSAVAAELTFGGGVGLIDSWLLHKPPVGADPDAPYVTTIGGTVGATSQSVVIPNAERLNGTYTLVGIPETYGGPGQRRLMTATITQSGTTATQVIEKAYVSAANLRPLVLGNVTLPLARRPAGGTSTLTIATVDTLWDVAGTSLLAYALLDSRGQTVAMFAVAPGTGYTLKAWLDEPSMATGLGDIWASPDATKAHGFAVSESRASGGPLAVSEEDNANVLVAIASGYIPDAPVITYHPRWLAERVT